MAHHLCQFEVTCGGKWSLIGKERGSLFTGRPAFSNTSLWTFLCHCYLMFLAICWKCTNRPSGVCSTAFIQWVYCWTWAIVWTILMPKIWCPHLQLETKAWIIVYIEIFSLPVVIPSTLSLFYPCLSSSILYPWGFCRTWSWSCAPKTELAYCLT